MDNSWASFRVASGYLDKTFADNLVFQRQSLHVQVSRGYSRNLFELSFIEIILGEQLQ